MSHHTSTSHSMLSGVSIKKKPTVTQVHTTQHAHQHSKKQHEPVVFHQPEVQSLSNERRRGGREEEYEEEEDSYTLPGLDSKVEEPNGQYEIKNNKRKRDEDTMDYLFNERNKLLRTLLYKTIGNIQEQGEVEDQVCFFSLIRNLKNYTIHCKSLFCINSYRKKRSS